VYNWKVMGSGYYSPDPIHGAYPISFTADGVFSVNYDPDQGFKSASSGYYGPAGDLDVLSPPYFIIGTDSIEFRGSGPRPLDVTISGEVGPLGVFGLPLSLAGLTSIRGTETGVYHNQLFSYSFHAAPEASSLLMLAIGVVAVGFVALGRGTPLRRTFGRAILRAV
jgi:hypothetical protein